MAKKDYSDPTSIFNILTFADKKDYGYYSRLTDEQKKQFNPYIIMRWFSTVEGNGDISKYYTVSTNEFVNANLFNLSKHKELIWQCICAASPGLNRQRHYWLGAAKGKGSSALKTLIMEQLPTTKESDIDLILSSTKKEDILEWLRNSGIEEKILKSLK